LAPGSNREFPGAFFIIFFFFCRKVFFRYDASVGVVNAAVFGLVPESSLVSDHLLHVYTFVVLDVICSYVGGIVAKLLLATRFLEIWGRCYDHNFLRFLPILGENIGFFQKSMLWSKFCKN
jgi:hypothetical protein